MLQNMVYTKTRPAGGVNGAAAANSFKYTLPLPTELTLTPSSDLTDPGRYRGIAPDPNLNELAAAAPPAGWPRFSFCYSKDKCIQHQEYRRYSRPHTMIVTLCGLSRL